LRKRLAALSGLRFGHDALASTLHLKNNLLLAQSATSHLQPGVADHISHVWSVAWIVLEHHLDQVHKGWREVAFRSALAVQLPERTTLVRLEQLVE